MPADHAVDVEILALFHAVTRLMFRRK